MNWEVNIHGQVVMESENDVAVVIGAGITMQSARDAAKTLAKDGNITIVFLKQ